MRESSTPTGPKSKLKWQCRRGMRELDDLLMAYLERHYDTSPDEEKSAFEALLALPDPELVGYLLKKERPAEPAFAAIIGRILDEDQR